MTRATTANPSVRVGIGRAGVPQEITVVAETICSYPVVLVQDDTVNAFADGKAIYVTTGMLRFVESDQELATVIAHELAHNAMDHAKAQNVNRAIGTIFDIVAAAYGVNTQGAFGDLAAQAYSKEFEAEADYVGVYALALGGTDTQGVANLWRRMGSEIGGIKTRYGASHPGSTERYVAIEATATEVNDKVVNMQPLTPNLKKKK
jgi:predicted Zn-dependent protease